MNEAIEAINREINKLMDDFMAKVERTPEDHAEFARALKEATARLREEAIAAHPYSAEKAFDALTQKLHKKAGTIGGPL